MVTGGCSEDKSPDIWKKLAGGKDESSAVPYETTVRDLQYRNGVQDFLVNSPSSEYTFDTGNDWKVNAYQQGTITWSLKCDLTGKTRTDALRALREPAISTDINTSLYFTLGLTLVTLFSLWAITICGMSFYLRKAIDKLSGWHFNASMMVMIYVPLLSLPSWWAVLASDVDETVSRTDNSLDRYKSYLIINECID